MKRPPTLSFCITCKNRFRQISETLPKNLRDNVMFKHLVEFVLVDFGSTDGLREWLLENYHKEMEEGYLKYYYTEELSNWHASVAKNTAHILAQNDIVVNLDCDNYTGQNGGKFVLQQFIRYGNDIILHQFSGKIRDGSYGRIAVSKENFIKIGGYDESFEPMGFQDRDLMIRLNLMGHRYILTPDSRYNQAIANSKEDSVANTDSAFNWLEMNEMNGSKSSKNTRNARLIANQKKVNIGISQNISRLI